MPDDDASDIEQEMVIEANDIFDSDDEEEEEIHTDNQQKSATDDCFYCKDGTIWNKKEPATVDRLRHHHTMPFVAGPKAKKFNLN